jgi:hypothetical protein
MKSKTYNGEVRSSEKDFETLQLGAFATPGLLLAQGPIGLTAESGVIRGILFNATRWFGSCSSSSEDML